MSLIIGLVGEKLAGKDTVANFLVEKYSAEHFRFTHILDEILEKLNLPISRQNEIDLGLALRKVFGERVLASAVISRAKKSSASIVVINGIRMDELEPVKNLGGKIVYITAPTELRFERYKSRREKTDDGVMNFEQFKEQEKGPTEVGIPALGAQADFKVENVGTVEELEEKVVSILNKIK
jgi:dephospho-CoA kinase